MKERKYYILLKFQYIKDQKNQHDYKNRNTGYNLNTLFLLAMYYYSYQLNILNASRFDNYENKYFIRIG